MLRTSNVDHDVAFRAGAEVDGNWLKLTGVVLSLEAPADGCSTDAEQIGYDVAEQLITADGNVCFKWIKRRLAVSAFPQEDHNEVQRLLTPTDSTTKKRADAG